MQWRSEPSMSVCLCRQHENWEMRYYCIVSSKGGLRNSVSATLNVMCYAFSLALTRFRRGYCWLYVVCANVQGSWGLNSWSPALVADTATKPLKYITDVHNWMASVFPFVQINSFNHHFTYYVCAMFCHTVWIPSCDIICWIRTTHSLNNVFK